jgi:hypothetical protein
MIPDPTGHEAEGIMELRTFGTMTRDLLVIRQPSIDGFG